MSTGAVAQVGGQASNNGLFKIKTNGTLKNNKSLFDVLPQYQKNNYEGINITPRPSTQYGIPYDKSFIFNALNNKNAHFNKSENDNGQFVNISFSDNEGRFISHQLSDYDKDGNADSYQLAIWEDENTREFWNDDDLDGNFDFYGKEIIDSESGEFITYVYDYDTDGNLDGYRV